jgi:hypothetical protein
VDFSELQREVGSIIQDASPDILVSIPDFINEALGQVADETYPPGLKSSFTVTTVLGTAYTSLPSDFSGKLSYAGTEDGAVTIYGSLETLLEEYPKLDEEGDINAVVVEGSSLYYQPIPATETTLTLVGYFSPDELVNDTDTPTCIPSFLHRELLVYKAAELAYTIIEDGVEGRKVNTEMYHGLYQNGLAKMSAWASRRGKQVTRKSFYL